MDSFLRQIEEIVELPPGSAAPGDQFWEYENWDSLAALLLLNQIQEEHGVTLSANDLLRVQNIEDLWRLMLSRKKN